MALWQEHQEFHEHIIVGNSVVEPGEIIYFSDPSENNIIKEATYNAFIVDDNNNISWILAEEGLISAHLVIGSHQRLYNRKRRS